jgi:regulator of protease activity HflC (stomatin/prohibitin superfamily)
MSHETRARRLVKGHAMSTVVERDPQLEPAAGPVGLQATEVKISEHPAWKANGFLGIALILVSVGLTVLCFIQADATESVALWVIGSVACLIPSIIGSSLTVVQPGRRQVVQFFGRYVGTVRQTGLLWLLPFVTHKTVSVRVRNFETAHLKVNDATGNPVEIAAIVVWQVADTAKATFAVENYDAFITVQAEAAVRHVAGTYPYDASDDAESLRGSTDQISLELAQEVAARVVAAGLEILEVRISHLAYSPEIAQAMLQRQQAAAVVAARSRIVEGAVGMVQMALEALSREGIVDLDEERKAAMVSNLLVVLCGDSRATPVVNTGTLYQ